MSTSSDIEWTDATWNCVRGCSICSTGCKNCYAMKQAHRFSGPGGAYEGMTRLGPNGPTWTGKVELIEDKLTEPLSWRKPRKVFVNSMSDLFHEALPDDAIDKVFDVMWRCPQHTFQVLTKRVDRMLSYVRSRASARHFGWVERDRYAMKPGDFISMDDIRMRNMCGYVGDADWSCDHPCHGGAEDSCDAVDCPIGQRVDERAKLEEIGIADEYSYGSDGYAETNGSDWLELTDRPLHAACGNVWLGFSAENQPTFEERARVFRALRDVLGPHFILFASLEPLLGPINFTMPYWSDGGAESLATWSALSNYDFSCAGLTLTKPYLDWVICGGESGYGARPFDVGWARSIVQQCKAAGVACFVKQLGADVRDAAANRDDMGARDVWPAGEQLPDGRWLPLVGSRKGGDMSEWPESLRVREFPKGIA